LLRAGKIGLFCKGIPQIEMQIHISFHFPLEMSQQLNYFIFNLGRRSAKLPRGEDEKGSSVGGTQQSV
jgi:hypothetical protein